VSFLDIKKQEAILKPQSGFRLKFFERFGKLFFKKVFQGFVLALKLYPNARKPGVRKRRPRNGGLVDDIASKRYISRHTSSHV
jgi:hypothetical protein